MMSSILMIVTRYTILKETNEVLPSLSNARVSFPILFIIKVVYYYIAFVKKLVDNTVLGSKRWLFHLIQDLDKEIY